jgi:predicted nucleic acid-binding protein
MRFWDSSALVPLIVEEERSAACRALRRSDRSMVVWMLSRTELVSALHRLAREGRLEKKDIAAALRRLDRLARAWTEVEAVDPTRDRAERALAVHALTAADALQLGAALVAARDRPKNRTFVTADDRLGEAASAEGFDVVTPGA